MFLTAWGRLSMLARAWTAEGATNKRHQEERTQQVGRGSGGSGRSGVLYGFEFSTMG